MRTSDSALRKNNLGYGPERFTCLPESNSYRCPAGEQLNYVGLNVRNRAHAYIGSAKRCGACSQKRSARVDDINISPFTSMSRHDNAPGSWPTHQGFPGHNDSERKSRHCLPN